jgi:N-acetylglucosaminyldiphosphoundecaprenol N-acetyl-beta-D-mannosaminyltransferase
VPPRRVEVLDVPVDCVTPASALERVEALIAGDRARAVIAVNPEKVIAARRRPELLRTLRDAGLLIPDGIGLVVAARWFGARPIERVPGAELMPAVCDLAARRGWGVFLFGGAPDVSRGAAEALRARYPGLRIVGSEHGYLPDGTADELIGRINASGAEVLFIALGSPRQELWMERHLASLRVKVCQGVGGTFDVLAGRARRAPALWRKLHLEWLYRLLADPKRLPRQTALPRFALEVFWRRVVG